MAVCTTNLGLQHCRQDPHDPEALRFGLQMLNKVIDILGQFKLGGRQLRNSLGAPIKNDQGAIIRIPWVLPEPHLDLPGLRVWAEGGGGNVPPGGIIAWSGYVSNIPDGWTLCDGTNDAPDLTYKFILGASAAGGIGSTGGNAVHGAGTNDHGNHSAPVHAGTTTFTHTISNHTNSLSHAGLIANHDDDLSLAGLIEPHAENIEHTQPGDHDAHIHVNNTLGAGAAFDVIDGVNALNATGGATPNVTDSGGDTMVVGAMEPIGEDDTSEENHALIHGTIEHLSMYLDHTVSDLSLDLAHVVSSHTLNLAHTGPGDHDLTAVTHTFDGSHGSTDNRGPYMLLCWIMKLAGTDQTFPNTPFS